MKSLHQSPYGYLSLSAIGFIGTTLWGKSGTHAMRTVEENDPFFLLSDDEFHALIPEKQIAYFQRALKLDDDIKQQLRRLATKRIPD